MREFIDGATAVARGALDAGCTFFAGYPITPATPILVHMMRELPKVGGVAIQAEDEIAAAGMCIGAALAGARAMTATSGPGLSLMSENIGLAIMGEVPLVIVDAQRMGPATGGATTVAQGDVQFIRWGTSGGYPLIALAPTNVADCYSLTLRAFDLAERFRTPTILAADKEVVMTLETVEVADGRPAPVRARVHAAESQHFVPYRVGELSDVPAMSQMGGPHAVRFTGSTHDERGFLAKDPAKVARLNAHLAAKIEAHRDEIELVGADLQDGAETLVVSYGTTARSAVQAVRAARQASRKVSLLIVYSLWPVPERAIRDALRGVRRVIVPELNLGQYRLEIERLAGDRQVIGVQRVDGELITPEEIVGVMRDTGYGMRDAGYLMRPERRAAESKDA